MTFPLRGKLEWIILVAAMTVPFLASIIYFDLLSGHPIAGFIYGATKIFNLAWPLIGTFLFIKVWIPVLEIKHSRHREALPAGLYTGLAIAAIIFLGLLTPVGGAVFANAGQIQEKARELGFDRFYIPFAIFLSFFHSLLEEYYWRWFVYGNLRQLINPIKANFLSALAFASHHVIVLKEYFPWHWALFFGASVGLGGILWNALYERQKTLTGAWLSHAIVDLTIMTVGYFVIFHTP